MIACKSLLRTLRHKPWRAKVALLWFALTLVAAGASPMLHPQTQLVICTSAGMLKVVLTDDGTATTLPADTAAGLFCPLCMVGDAPTAAGKNTPAPQQALSHVRQSNPADRPAAFTVTPPPARGPPPA